MYRLHFDARLFRECATWVAHMPARDIFSCGDTQAQARRNLRQAVRLFLEAAERMDTLSEILTEAYCRC